jgi:Domain of unknown function (DUF4158)
VVVEFLTDEQAAGYGQFQADLSQPELERFFILDDADRDLAAAGVVSIRGWGSLFKLGTERFLGTFSSPEPLELPWSVVDYLAGQPGITGGSISPAWTLIPDLPRGGGVAGNAPSRRLP